MEGRQAKGPHLQALSLVGKEPLGRWVTALEAGRQETGRNWPGSKPGSRAPARWGVQGREGRRALLPTGVDSSRRRRPPFAG